MIEEPTSDDEWLVETEEPYLIDDIAWLDEGGEEDEARKVNGDEDFLDVTALLMKLLALRLIMSLEKRDKESIVLPWTKGKGPPLMM